MESNDTTGPSPVAKQTDQMSAYTWSPCSILLVVISIYMIMLMFKGKTDQRPAHLGTLTSIKVYTAILLALMSVIQLAYSGQNIISVFTNPDPCEGWTKITEAGVFGMMAALTTTNRRRGSSGRSFPQIIVWGTMLLTTASTVYPFPSSAVYPSGFETAYIVSITRFLTILLAFSLSWFSDKDSTATTKMPDGTSAESEYLHPEDSAGWLSYVLLGWSTCMVWIGINRDLEEKDVPPLNHRDKISKVFPALNDAWKQEEFRCKLINESRGASPKLEDHKTERVESEGDALLENSQETGSDPKSKKEKVAETRSLFKALLKTYGPKFFILQCSKGVMEMHVFIKPLMTAALMNYIQNRENESVWNGIGIVVGLFLCTCITETIHHRLWFSILRLSRNMKSSVIMLVYQKSLSLQNESKKDMTNGEIVSLISDDCTRVFDLGQVIFLIFMAPLKVCTALYLLYINLGESMIVGVAIMIVLLPFNGYIGRKMNDVNNYRNEVKDKRVKLMNEIINGIKILKLYAWEKSFIHKVDNIRGEEIKACKKKAVYDACIDSIFRAIPLLVQFGAFGTYLILGGHLDPTKGFLAINLFQNLNHPLSLLALLLPVYMEALVSLRRITKFLNGEDISSEAVNKFAVGELAVRVKDGVFTWEKSNDKPTLSNINVEIPKGQLVAVVGTVGSGKSSLLSSIMGEMQNLSGTVEVQGRLAYVPQEAWILNASLQDNVLFGSEMDKEWYREVVQGSSLKNDINILEAGDKTEIGEKGINLSGGQKQRVSLARAVYNNADVYLLDDPLSAVDAHVGKSIFNKVIGPRGLLQRKSRILVTHGVHWLPFVDSIIVVKDGQVSEMGTYKELLSRDGDFAQFLRNVCAKTTVDEDEDVKKLKQNIFRRLNSVESQRKQEIETLKEELDHFQISADDDNGDDNHLDNWQGDNGKSAGKLIDDEETEQGAVKKEIYLDYLRAIGYRSITFFLSMFLVSFIADNCNSYSIKVWTDDPLLANTSLSHTGEYSSRSWSHFYSFLFTGVIEVTSAFIFIMLTMQGAFNAANKIHKTLLNNVLKCPMSFFDTTPSCRVINRFSTDTNRVDGLTGCLRAIIERFFYMLLSLVLVIMNAPLSLIAVVPASFLYYFLHRIHISTLRQLRRYNSKHRSPIFVHFSETLNGVSSIRAYSCEERFTKTMVTRLEGWLKFNIIEFAVSIWFGLCLTFLYLFIEMAVSIVVVFDTTMTAGMAGLVLIYAGNFAQNLQRLIHLMTHVETEIISLERVLEYAKKPSEAPWDLMEGKAAADWPKDGRVVLNDYKARYRDGLDLVLKGVNCTIKNGEKIGIVGRTGAGKSSLTMALFRLVEAASGHIEVDSERIADLGLHDLRSKITILPQDPVIFAGSLRMNLDPFERCSTEELWEALSHSHLKSFVEGLPNQLDFECGEGGKNLSVGQRQLLCLARTLLRQTRILVLDEATAAVDMETDELIQKTIRKEFSDCTILTIAHRLNTIMDYDRILVMDQGVVREFDTPKNLLSDKDSVFYSLAKDAKLVQ